MAVRSEAGEERQFLRRTKKTTLFLRTVLLAYDPEESFLWKGFAAMTQEIGPVINPPPPSCCLSSIGEYNGGGMGRIGECLLRKQRAATERRAYTV